MKLAKIVIVAFFFLVLFPLPLTYADHNGGPEGIPVLAPLAHPFCSGMAYCSICTTNQNHPDVVRTRDRCGALGADIVTTPCWTSQQPNWRWVKIPGRFVPNPYQGPGDAHPRMVRGTAYACSDELRILHPDLVQNPDGTATAYWETTIYADSEITLTRGEERINYEDIEQVKRHVMTFGGLTIGDYNYQIESCSGATGRCATFEGIFTYTGAADGAPTLTFVAPTPADGGEARGAFTIAIQSSEPLRLALLRLRVPRGGELNPELEQIDPLHYATTVSGLEPGTYTYSVTGTDLMGEMSISESRTVTVLDGLPEPPIINFVLPTPADGSGIREALTVAIESNEDLRHATLRLSADGIPFGDYGMTVIDPTHHSATVEGLAARTYSYYVLATDLMGEDGESEMRSVRILPARDPATWYSLDYTACKSIAVTAPANVDLAGYPMTVTIERLTKREDNNDLRIINAPCNAGGSEIPRDVLASDASSATVLFSVTVARGATVTYSVYYNNPAAAAPSYLTNLNGYANAIAGDFELRNGFVKVASTPDPNAGLRLDYFGYDASGAGGYTNIINPGIGVRGLGWYVYSNGELSDMDRTSRCALSFNGAVKKSVVCWWPQASRNTTWQLEVYNGFPFAKFRARTYWTAIEAANPIIHPIYTLWTNPGEQWSRYYEDGRLFDWQATPPYPAIPEQGAIEPVREAITYSAPQAQSYIITQFQRTISKMDFFLLELGITRSPALAPAAFRCYSSAPRTMEPGDECIQEMWMTGQVDPGNFAWQFWMPPTYLILEE